MTGGEGILQCGVCWAQSEIGAVIWTYYSSWGGPIERRGKGILIWSGND